MSKFKWEVIFKSWRITKNMVFGKSSDPVKWKNVDIRIYSGPSCIGVSTTNPRVFVVRGRYSFLENAKPETKLSLRDYIIENYEEPEIISPEDHLRALGVLV